MIYRELLAGLQGPSPRVPIKDWRTTNLSSFHAVSSILSVFQVETRVLLSENEFLLQDRGALRPFRPSGSKLVPWGNCPFRHQ